MALKVPIDERIPTLTIENEVVIVPSMSPYATRLLEVPSSGEGVKLRRITGAVKTGTGSGIFTSSGLYTGLITRNIKIEIDTQGDIAGTATFKWSDDGGSTWKGTLIPIEDEDPFELELGISISFTAGTGTDFILGDYCLFDAEYWTEVVSVPMSLKEFQVDYASGLITFYSGDANKSPYGTYEGRGSLVKSSDLSQLIDILNSGELCIRNLDTSGFTVRKLIGVNASGVYALAQPGPGGSIVPAIGFVKTVHATEGDIQLFGPLDGFTSLTPNTRLYLVADGGISITAPVTSGWIQQLVGRVMNSTKILIKIDEDYITN